MLRMHITRSPRSSLKGVPLAVKLVFSQEGKGFDTVMSPRTHTFTVAITIHVRGVVHKVCHFILITYTISVQAAGEKVLDFFAITNTVGIGVQAPGQVMRRCLHCACHEQRGIAPAEKALKHLKLRNTELYFGGSLIENIT